MDFLVCNKSESQSHYIKKEKEKKICNLVAKLQFSQKLPIGQEASSIFIHNVSFK